MQDILRELAPNIEKIEDVDIRNSENHPIGWHTTIYDKQGKPLGGGCHTEKNTSRRIAVAETLERALVSKIYHADSMIEFAMDKFPTTCGFAFGFENQPCLFRAICEAIERWLWSKWIDEGFTLPETTISCFG